MENLKKQTACPSPEELGDVIDGTATAELAAHLTSCEQCQRTLSELRQVDTLSSQTFLPSKDFAARIRAACAREAEKADADRVWQNLSGLCEASPERKSLHWPKFLAMAASFVVVSLISVFATATYLHKSIPKSLNTASTIAAGNSVESLPEQPSAQYATYFTPISAQPFTERSQQIASAEHAGFSLADSRRLQLTGHSRDDAVSGVETVSNEAKRLQSSAALRQLTLLPAEIEHVWMESPDLTALEFLRQTEAEHPEILAGASEPDDQGIVTVQLKANDLSVQDLTDILYNHGKWELLSANYPQPGRGDEVAFRDQPLQYTLKILTK